MASTSDLSDEEIVSRVQRGDQDLFGIIIERYEPKLMRYAHKFLGDNDDCKDLVQDSFIKAYVNIQSFNTDKRFSPWMYRIAHNEFVNSLKKKSRAPTIPFDPDTLLPHPIAPETSDGEAIKQEMRRMLDGSLSGMSPKYREPLVLYYFEDMDYRQIANVLEIPISTVGVRLKRGKSLLKKMVESQTILAHG